MTYVAMSEDIPLQYQRAFGAGLKRGRINFVPQTQSDDSLSSKSPPSQSVQDLYLSIVLPQPVDSSNTTFKAPITGENAEGIVASSDALPASDTEVALCPVCKLPLTNPSSSLPSDGAGHAIISHEASIAHQVCVVHTHPPSALDRRRKGLQYLKAQGWDADARLGLGASGEGRLYPVQAKRKEDNAGIGAKLEIKTSAKVVKAKILGAGEVRKAEEEARRKGKRIEQLLHGSEEVNRYLGNSL